MKKSEEYWHYYDLIALITTAFLTNSIKDYGELFIDDYPKLYWVSVLSIVLVIIIVMILGIFKKKTRDYTVMAGRVFCTMMILHWFLLYMMYG
jgi:hypothetical protein